MDDDDDVVASAEFDRPAGAFLEVHSKARRFQHGGAKDLPLQMTDVSLFHDFPRHKSACPSCFSLGFRAFRASPPQGRLGASLAKGASDATDEMRSDVARGGSFPWRAPPPKWHQAGAIAGSMSRPEPMRIELVDDVEIVFDIEFIGR